jgi:hypothetical protein
MVCSIVSNAWATGPYTARISTLQVTDVGSSFNNVFLQLDITNSPCASTNQHNRFTIRNNAQQSVVLAAVMADKPITIFGTGACNSGGNEEIQEVRVSP